MSKRWCVIAISLLSCLTAAAQKQTAPCATLFWFTVPGQMDRAGKGSTTSSSKTATTSASSKSTAIKKTADGFTYLDPAQFHEYFRPSRRASRFHVTITGFERSWKF